MPSKSTLSLPFPKTAIGFKPRHFNFERGIQVGNLEDNERITRILKLELEYRYREPFVTERYGRGVYWQWIGYLPRSNRTAKPLSSHASFGCSKLFLMVDTDEKLLKFGLQVERGRVAREGRGRSDFTLQSDWDWHRLIQSLKPGSPMERELKRLVTREGFRIRAGTWTNPADISRSNWTGAAGLGKILRRITPSDWGFFQAYYAMNENEAQGSSGVDLIEAILAAFYEVTPAMNACMQVELATTPGAN